MSDTKNLASPYFMFYIVCYIAAWNSALHQIGVVAFVLRRLIGPLLYTQLLFKACLSANHFCAQYWPNSKGVCAIYIFRPHPDFQRGEPLGIRGLLRKTRTLFGLELWSKFVFKDFASSSLPGFGYGDSWQTLEPTTSASYPTRYWYLKMTCPQIERLKC
jgi:hypothetical protein